MFFFNKKGDLVICGAIGVVSITFNNQLKDYKFEWILRKPSMFTLESKFGGYWIATQQNGLFRIKDGMLLQITDKNGLPTNNLYTLFEDREGILWIGTALRGITKLPTLKFTNFGKAEGFLQEGISSITMHNDAIYCTTENGIFLFQEPFFRRIKIVENEVSSSAPRFLFHMLPLSGNKYLLGGVDGLDILKDNGVLENIGLKGMWVQTFLRDSREQIWIGTNKGLFKLQGERTIIPQDIGEGELNINALLEVNSTDLYLGTTDGVFILGNRTTSGGEKNVKKITTDNGLLSNLILDLSLTSSGEIIIGTAKGINIINKVGMYSITEGLSSGYIIDIYIDRKGRLWAGTYNGLYCFEKIGDKYNLAREYYKKDGLISNEFTRNNTITEDSEGCIWIGYYGGLTKYRLWKMMK